MMASEIEDGSDLENNSYILTGGYNNDNNDEDLFEQLEFQLSSKNN